MGDAMAHNLVRRHRAWYCQLNVPKDVQKRLRKTKLRQSLKTRDYDNVRPM